MSNVDVSLLQRAVQQLQDKLDHATPREGGGPPGGGSGGNEELEKRIEKLEAAIPDIQVRLVRIETKIDQTATATGLQDLKIDLLKTINDQTWKYIGVAGVLAGLAFTAAKFIG